MITLERLNLFSIGCRVGRRYVGALVYIDDVAHSLSNIKRMIKIGEYYAEEHPLSSITLQSLSHYVVFCYLILLLILHIK